VVGLPPNLFYGTGIPACILVLRAPHAKPRERAGQVLFINADAEYYARRAQNYLRPEHIEKIVSTFEAFRDVERYARVVTLAELAENDYNLNVRRYADNAPPPELHDVRAHLLGGVPRAEVEAQRALLDAVGLKPETIFVPRPPIADGRPAMRDDKQQLDVGGLPSAVIPTSYLDFHPGITERAHIKPRIEADPGVQARAAHLRDVFVGWWKAQESHLAALPGSNNLFNVRTDLLDSFQKALLPVGMLDRFQVAGVVASWWNEIQYDLKTLAAQGFYGLVDSWIASLRAGVEDEETRSSDDPLEHPLVRHLLPDYLDRLAALEAAVADLKARMAEAEQESKVGQDAILSHSLVEVDSLRVELRLKRSELKALQAELLAHLDAARAALAPDEAQALVLEIERERLAAELERYVAAQRQRAIATVENWWDKYRVSLQEIEAEQEEAVKQMQGFIQELGYVWF
jgi:type I restriction enzyme M protein